ncbi:hypothetical protein AB0758_48020 [Tolypothrix bouteillei VB521301_2]
MAFIVGSAQVVNVEALVNSAQPQENSSLASGLAGVGRGDDLCWRYTAAMP